MAIDKTRVKTVLSATAPDEALLRTAGKKVAASGNQVRQVQKTASTPVANQPNARPVAKTQYVAGSAPQVAASRFSGLHASRFAARPSVRKLSGDDIVALAERSPAEAVRTLRAIATSAFSQAYMDAAGRYRTVEEGGDHASA
ncbi:MAG: hypothetical protein HY696_05340 [Deltaproteobacteria bacterium]|nr:hypothetical protein [Deltaproteobacteria bacterium]